MIREKIILQRKYRKPYDTIAQPLLPVLAHLNDGFRCVEVGIVEDGIIERDGKEYEYQTIRLLIQETAKTDGEKT